MSETWGSYLFVYLYDADGSPIGMQCRVKSMAEGVFYTFWFEKNLQGDIVAVYDDSGNKLYSYAYDAWGNCVATRHSTLTAARYAQYNPFRYRGYYYDTETGFYYLQSRYYDPNTGRFVSADGQLNGGLLGDNQFAYCENNPVMGIDPTGEFAITATTTALFTLAALITIVLIANLPEIVETTNEVVTDVYEGIQDGVQNVQDAISETASKDEVVTTRRPPRNPVHHIVAQADKRAYIAQRILEEANINRYNDPANLVVLPTFYHRRMHTQYYYDYVNRVIETAWNEGGTEAVYEALGVLRWEITYGTLW